MNKTSGILMLLIYVCVAITLLDGSFVREDNLFNLLRWTSIYGIFGIAAAFVIITGGIDLSIGSVIGLLGCLLPMLLVRHGWSVAESLGAVVLGAIVIGLTHGLLITKMKLQPFVVTLCGLLIYRGLSRWMTRDESQGFGTGYDDSLRLLATGAPCSVAFVVMVAGGMMALFFLGRTIFGLGQRGEWRRTAENILGLLCGAALAAIGSSRYWDGYQINYGRGIDVLGNIRIPTWQTIVSAEAARLPGELLWWCGLLAIPFAIWFIGLAARKNLRFLRSVVVQVLIVAIFLPIAIYGVALPLCEYLADFTNHPLVHEPWPGRWHMLEVFISLGVIMATLAWFVRTGLRLGGPAARVPTIAMGVTAIMWLLGKSQIAHDWLWDIGTPDQLLGLSGNTQLLEVLVPAPFFVLLILALAAAVFLNLTIYGRYLFALGRNEQAARYSGIRTDQMVILAYVICAVVTGLGAILFTLDGNAVQPAGHGSSYELYAIAAAVLGGCSLRGGEGSIFGVVIGAAVMRVLYNSINLLGVPQQLQLTIIGLVILLGVLADEFAKRIAARRRSTEQAAAAESRLGRNLVGPV